AIVVAHLRPKENISDPIDLASFVNRVVAVFHVCVWLSSRFQTLFGVHSFGVTLFATRRRRPRALSPQYLYRFGRGGSKHLCRRPEKERRFPNRRTHHGRDGALRRPHVCTQRLIAI